MNIREIIGELETRRKMFHLIALLLWLLPLYLFPLWLVFLLFTLVLLLNFLTLLKVGNHRLSFYYRLVYGLERERNYSRPGIQALWANLGIFMSLLLFGREPAMVAVVVLAVGDAFASIVGINYGRRRIGDRSLEGTSAFFLSTFFVLLPFLGFWKAFLVCFFSALVELAPLKLDDNFTVPLTAGLLYHLLT
ncbi:MAG: phosphatidate cytidylyltransferase [Aquificaceae bacterium]|nr:phosphatidate cytidylyltransferase [Aquificaceae bacterium]MCS7196471.1 phosphatidate cytidylyltransferase [Aquificaceae bacterium]MCX7989514.1 phosphatidate cytidylyltransferase [Aquificaceae bacterium]MDW8032632.1 phosphatidate cytidylyltransferase [Aquificaceae bacterium]MDW8294486.1 phosphatidate cytidylyltransferase [Aquificaceae bacterium]